MPFWVRKWKLNNLEALKLETVKDFVSILFLLRRGYAIDWFLVLVSAYGSNCSELMACSGRFLPLGVNVTIMWLP